MCSYLDYGDIYHLVAIWTSPFSWLTVASYHEIEVELEIEKQVNHHHSPGGKQQQMRTFFYNTT